MDTRALYRPVCEKCHKNESSYENADGHFLCDHCLDEICQSCEWRDQEIDNLCIDCASGDADSLYDMWKESQWE